mgnify:CR=1 FL=1
MTGVLSQSTGDLVTDLSEVPAEIQLQLWIEEYRSMKVPEFNIVAAFMDVDGNTISIEIRTLAQQEEGVRWLITGNMANESARKISVEILAEQSKRVKGRLIEFLPKPSVDHTVSSVQSGQHNVWGGVAGKLQGNGW